jgi:ABC-2 type transport system permease protein
MNAAPTHPTPSVALRPTSQLGWLLRRNLIKSVRVPQLLMYSMAMPLAMLVLFSQVFRSIGAASTFPAGVAYIDFTTPALLAVSTVMSGTNSGVAIATDTSTGVFARFSTLPVDLRLVYVARSLTEIVLTVVRVVVLLTAAWLLLGFEHHGSAADLAAMIGLLLPLSLAMSWLFMLVGTRLGNPEVVQFAGMMLMMPFMFVSSAFAPLDTMPGWLEAAANANPVTHTIDAVRSLALGEPDTGTAVAAVLSALALATLAAVATSRAARHRR